MTKTANSQEIPIKLVGSSVFGRYPTISSERTYNMFISSSGDGGEEWLVNFPGYAARNTLVTGATVGRGLFHSVRGDFLLAVVGSAVIRINTVSSAAITVGSISTSEGEVSIDENLNSQICIVDGLHAYIYNYATGNVAQVTFTGNPSGVVLNMPNYVTFQNTYFIFGNGEQVPSGSTWFIYNSGYDPNDGLTAQTLSYVQSLALQTKPDYAIAALRVPSSANTLILFGTTVAEIWSQVPTTAVYQRNQSVNIDYGCVSVSTIASSDNVVAWLAINEKSSPSIMVMSGGQAQRISSDGIDFLMDEINHPEQSTGMFFRQDGHLFYQLTFFNATDNLTIIYDFTTQKFFDLTDWNNSYHPARQVAYYNGQMYFVSLKDANLYEFGSDLTTYNIIDGLVDYDIPRVRISDTFRLPTPDKFRVNLFTFVVESGTTTGVSDRAQCEGYVLNEDGRIIYTEDDLPILTEQGSCQVFKPRIDLTISKNGGITWSNTVPYTMHNTANYRAQPRFDRLGFCNQITFQMRIWNWGRSVIKNAMIEVGQ